MRRFLHTLLAALAIGCASTAAATSMVPVNIAQMAESAESAFRGTVNSVAVVETEMGWADMVTMTVSEPILGTVAEGNTVTWFQYRFSESHRVPALPVLEPGQERVVFLSARAEGSLFQAPVGLDQGFFAVTREPKSGALLVTNRYQNRQLLHNMDLPMAASAIAEAQPKSRQAKGNGEAAEAERLRRLMGGPLNLQDLKQVVQGLREAGVRAGELRSKSTPAMVAPCMQGCTTCPAE